MKNHITLLFLLTTISLSSQLNPKIFVNFGIHEQTEKMFGTQTAYQIGGMIDTSEDIGFRAAFTQAIDLPDDSFQQLDLKAFYRFYEDDVFKAYLNAGLAYETSISETRPTFGFDMTVRTGKLIDIIFTWQPVINGKFRGDNGWTNHVGIGLLFKLYKEKCFCR